MIESNCRAPGVPIDLRCRPKNKPHFFKAGGVWHCDPKGNDVAVDMRVIVFLASVNSVTTTTVKP